MYCSVLYCIVTVLWCTVLCCTVLWCTVLCCTVLWCTVLYCTVLCCTVLLLLLYCTVSLCTVLHCTVLCCVCCAVLYCTALHCLTVTVTVTVTLSILIEVYSTQPAWPVDSFIVYSQYQMWVFCATWQLENPFFYRHEFEKLVEMTRCQSGVVMCGLVLLKYFGLDDVWIVVYMIQTCLKSWVIIVVISLSLVWFGTIVMDFSVGGGVGICDLVGCCVSGRLGVFSLGVVDPYL